MKILIVQLARLGDIYMTWPIVRALKRSHPMAEIHYLCRSRFQGAVRGLDEVQKVHILETSKILEPLFNQEDQCDRALKNLGDFIANLEKEKFSRVINLSFSTLSSYLVKTIGGSETQVSGYTRHEDGYLNLPEEFSSYFYAQVGIEKFNRVHLVDIFAGVADVELAEEDWRGPTPGGSFEIDSPYFVVHVGTSESQKSIPGFKWARILRRVLENNQRHKVVLVGAPEERAIADSITGALDSSRTVDLVGKTILKDLFPVIAGAELIVGGDSAPMHIASLVKTPCLNISVGRVNFWETGPKSPGSFVYRVKSVEEIVSEYLASAICELIKKRVPEELIQSISGIPSFRCRETNEERFNWDLISSIYLGTSFPMADRLQFYDSVLKLNQVNEVVLEQLQACRKKGRKEMIPYLERADEIITTIGRMEPSVQIYVDWLKAERTRIPPLEEEKLIERTEEMHLKLRVLLRPYMLPEEKEGTYG